MYKRQVNANGKVGIGSAEPNKQLDVIGDSGMLVASTTNGGTSSTGGISIFLSDNRYNPPQANHDLDQIGEINYKHTDVQSPEQNYSDTFTFKSTETNLAVDVEGTLLVGVTTSGQGGKVGIGTSIPAAKLDVNGSLNVSGFSTFTGLIDANGIIEGIAGQNKIPSLYNAFSDLPNAGTYHGMFAHVHEHGRGYFAHGGAWYELVNKESNGVVGTGTEKYNLGFTDTVNLKATGITTLGSIGISTGIISGPAITYIDPAAVGDNTGTLVVKGLSLIHI